MGKKKTTLKENVGTSVKLYKQGIDVEKQKMGAYSKKMGSSVKSLQNDFKKHARDMKEAAKNLRETGLRDMGTKIRAQIKENKEAISKMGDNIGYFQTQINSTRRDFQSWIKSFWG